MEDLRLEVADFAAPDGGLAWRWVLTEPGGVFVADHRVRLDAGEPGYEAFTDLAGYLRWRADPQDRVAGEAALVADAGRWIGERVFGEVGLALAERAPVVVNRPGFCGGSQSTGEWDDGSSTEVSGRAA